MFTGVSFEQAIDYWKKGKEVIVLDRHSQNASGGYDNFPFEELFRNVELLADVPAVENPEYLFWITYGSFSSSSRVAQCEWVFSYDENGNDDSYSEFYIDQSPCIYTPSQNLVKAWKIIDIPEPYRPERSEGE